MNQPNNEEGSIPLSSAEKAEVLIKIKSFMAENPISSAPVEDKPDQDLNNKVDCCDNAESAFVMGDDGLTILQLPEDKPSAKDFA